MDTTLSRFEVEGHADLTEFSAEIEMVDKGGNEMEGAPVAEGIKVDMKAAPRGNGGKFLKKS